MLSKKDTALLFLTFSKQRDPLALELVHPKKYIYNRETSSKGILGFAEKMLRQQEYYSNIKPLQIIQDGDFISTVSHYQGHQSWLGIDILRLCNNKIVEHWENNIATSFRMKTELLFPSFKSTKERKLKTNENKIVAVNFIKEIYFLKNLKSIWRYTDKQNYTYFNTMEPETESGINNSIKISSLMRKREYKEIVKVMAEGNQAIVYSKGIIQNKPVTLIDLFTFENNKITIHQQMADFA
jgi:predicted SnoaL-like aldol condensation-catalyzing enzyme